ncbi:MAG: ice-binding family protein, partial [Isosphaeraceae bacterium]|nr:ice-binding family protein [Isosphaeraceae bacterium]
MVQALEECEDRILMAVVSLGAAQTFAVLGATTVTNTGLTTIVGDLGVSPGTAVTGFPPGIVTGGTIHSNDPIATQAEADAATAYGVLAGETPTTDLTGQDLGGLTLAPGVYHFATSAALSGILTLDAQGNPNARFDFQIGTTLTTAIGSAVHLINGAQANNVFFQVGSSATLGVDTAFEGNILALTSITLTTGASMLDGRALALNGAVTLDTNSLAAPVNPPPVLATINPASTPENQGSIVLTVTGTNFIPSSIVQFNGVPLVTTYVSGTQLQAIVPAGDVGEEGVAAITVANPPPGGGTSDPAQLTITDPSVIATGGFTLAVAFGTPTGLQTVATFTDPGGAEPNPNDPDPPDLNGHYAATINWGDGSPNTPGTITFNAVTQVFTVSGDHTYTTGSGAFPITVTIDHEASAPVTVVSTADVSDAPITADPVPVFGTEGAPLTNVDVATFTDPDPSSRAGDFVTTVNWGDGTTTAGTVVEDAAGTFHVQGSHTYTEESAIPIPITVLIIDVAGGRAVDDPTNSTATVVSPATIRQSPLLPVASAVVATEGAPLAAGTPLASFTDTGGADPVSDYTATVNWGDGGPTTAATVSLLGNGGNFAVTSATPHIYAEEGIYAVTVTITDADPTNLNGVPTSAMTTTTATVADAPLTAIASPPFPPAVEGSALTAQVASFTDANLLASITDFTATIDWGDGTPITTGTVTGGGDGAPFIVSGGHTYAEAGTYTIHTTVNDDGGQQASMTLAAVVSDAPLSGGTAIAIAGNEGQLLNNIPVAVFVDANPDATPADIIATIDWGDGSPSTPGVVTKIGSTGTGASIFQVSGTHTYVTSVGLAATATVSIADEDTFAINGGVPQIILNPALTIAPGAIDVIALPLVATVGVSTPPLFVVATFTDTTGADATSSYSATLDWGDSTSNDTTNGLVIVPLGGDQFEIEA